MKFRTKTEEYTEPYTRDGRTVSVPKERKIPTPVMPRDWDRAGVRFAVTLVVVLTAVSVVWSTVSIGALLNGGVGYAAAVIFDFAWALCLVLEYLARFDSDKRAFPNRLGWALLVATMGAIFWHGMTLGLVGMAVGGAAVSMFAKILWLGVMKHVHRELSPEDAAWVKAEISEANAKAAVADARRTAAKIEQRAALDLLAMERERDAVARAFGLPVQSPGASAPAPVADAPQDAELIETAPAAIAPVAPAVDIAAIVAAVLAAQGAAPSGASAPAPVTDETPDADVIGDQEEREALPPLEPPTLSDVSKADAIRIAMAKRPGLSPAKIADLLATYGVTVTADYVRQIRNRDREEAAYSGGGTSADVVPIRKV